MLLSLVFHHFKDWRGFVRQERLANRGHREGREDKRESLRKEDRENLGRAYE